MYASEAETYSAAEFGCVTHARVDCLCDVHPLSRGVPIRRVPFPERLMELGVSRLAFVTWAEEITAWQESQSQGLQLVGEG